MFLSYGIALLCKVDNVESDCGEEYQTTITTSSI